MNCCCSDPQCRINGCKAVQQQAIRPPLGQQAQFYQPCFRFDCQQLQAKIKAAEIREKKLIKALEYCACGEMDDADFHNMEQFDLAVGNIKIANNAREALAENKSLREIEK